MSRGEVAVAGRPRAAPRWPIERQVVGRVVADRKRVVPAGAFSQPSHAPPLNCARPPSYGVVGVGDARSPGTSVRWCVSCGRRRGRVVRPPGAVGARQPAEEVVEGAVLHHQHDDVLDPGLLRCREGRDGRGGPGGRLGDRACRRLLRRRAAGCYARDAQPSQARALENSTPCRLCTHITVVHIPRHHAVSVG